jgi:hypothetical protein
MQDDFTGGNLGGEIEIDETFIGGKARNMHKDRRTKAAAAKGGDAGFCITKPSYSASWNARPKRNPGVFAPASSLIASATLSPLKYKRMLRRDRRSTPMTAAASGARTWAICTCAKWSAILGPTFRATSYQHS